MEGSNSPQLYTVLEGMGTRYKTLENSKRQVINFLFPGDFTGLQAGIMGEMQHSVEATTPITLCAFRRNDLWQLFRQHPERAHDLTWIGPLPSCPPSARSCRSSSRLALPCSFTEPAVRSLARHFHVTGYKKAVQSGYSF